MGTSLTPRGGAPAASSPAPFLEAYDVIDDLWDTGSTSETLVRGGWARQAGNVASFWPAASGGAAVITLLANGTRAWAMVAAAKMSEKGCSTYALPLSKKNGAQDLKPFYRRYRFAVLAWRDVLTGGARVQLGVNMQNDGRSLDDFLSIFGLEVTSISTLYGGNWHVRKRLVDSGAIVTGPDSTLSATVPRRIVVDYLEGAVRSLAVRIDGTQVYRETGEAALAFAPAGAASSGKTFAPFVGIGGGIGSTLFFRDAMYRMEMLADPWAST